MKHYWMHKCKNITYNIFILVFVPSLVTDSPLCLCGLIVDAWNQLMYQRKGRKKSDKKYT